MPNWCECDLRVSGPKKRVNEFVAFAKGIDDAEPTPFDFNRFIPYPAEFEELDRAHAEFFGCTSPDEWTAEELLAAPRDGYNSGGYEWCVENWGTKWNALNPELDEQHECAGELEVLVRFETAWSPPLPVVKRASELFPDLEFELRYFERGDAFNGCYRCERGEVVYDESGPYFGERGG